MHINTSHTLRQNLVKGPKKPRMIGVLSKVQNLANYKGKTVSKPKLGKKKQTMRQYGDKGYVPSNGYGVGP